MPDGAWRADASREPSRGVGARLKEMFPPLEVTRLADTFAGITTHIDPELLHGGVSKQLVDQLKLLAPSDSYWAGLKGLMPAESLSAAIAKSLAFDKDTTLERREVHLADIFTEGLMTPDAYKVALRQLRQQRSNLMRRLDGGSNDDAPLARIRRLLENAKTVWDAHVALPLAQQRHIAATLFHEVRLSAVCQFQADSSMRSISVRHGFDRVLCYKSQ